jgi:hypothetical protein
MLAASLRAVVVTAALLALPGPAYALCSWLGPPCSTFWSYEAVFEGTVVSIEQKPADPLDTGLRVPFRIVTFEIHRSWRGDRGPRIQIKSPGGPNVWVEDAFNFSMNRRYLVFARRPSEGAPLSTSKCDPTVAMSSKDALVTLAFLDSLDKPSTGGRIYGDVQVLRANGGRDAVDANVVLQDAGGERRTVRTARGEFSFEAVPPGRYVVTVETAEGITGERVQSTAIEDPHQCRWISFYLRR